MAFGEGLINNDDKQKLLSLAGEDGKFDIQEFANFHKEVTNIYKDLSRGLRSKNRKKLTPEQISLVVAYEQLNEMSIDEKTGDAGGDLFKLREYTEKLFGKTRTPQDIKFFESFSSLKDINEEYAGQVKEINENTAALEHEIRVSQRHNEKDSYTGSTEKEEQKKRKQTRKLQKKEAKGKETTLMREALKAHFSQDVFKAHGSVLKKITRRLDDTSMSQILPIMQTWMEAGKGKDEVTKDKLPALLEEQGYIAKDGKLDNEEKKNIVRLYVLLQEQGGSDLFDFGKQTKQPQQAIAYLLRLVNSNTSLAHTIQATHITKTKSTSGGTSLDSLATSLSDINYDGALINAPDSKAPASRNTYKQREKKWESVDKALVMGTSLREMMIDAEHALGMEIGDKAEGQVIINISSALAGYVGDDALLDITTPEALDAIYTQQPHLLVATQQMLLEHGADARLILQYGTGNEALGIPSYTDIIEAIAAQEVVGVGSDELAEKLSNKQHEMIDDKLSDCFQKLIVSLEEQIKTELDIQLDENDLTEEQRQQARKDTKKFVSSLAQKDKDYINKRELNTLSVLASTITGNEGIGLGTSMNVWLKDPQNLEGFIQYISTSGGIFIDKSGQPAVGIAVSAGASQQFGKEKQHTFYYAGGVGVGYAQNGLQAGPFVGLGTETQINTGKIKNSLDATSAKHIGALVNGTLGAVGGTLYRSQDKLKGYEQAKANIEGTFSGIFDGLEELDGTSTATILEQLQARYPKTTDVNLEATARTMSRLLLPFAERWTEMDSAVKGTILDKISKRYALSWLNTQVETKIGGLHISQVGVGLQFVGSYVLPTAGLGLSWYKSSTYKETPESLAAIKAAQEQGIGAREVAHMIDRNVVNKINRLFGVVGTDAVLGFLRRSDREYDVLTIPESLISQDGGRVNLHIHPAMKQFISHQDGELQVHANTPITVMSAYRQGVVEYDLIVGQVGLAGTEQVLLSDSDEDNTTKMTDFGGNPAEFDRYIDNQELLTQKKKLQEYLSGNSAVARALHAGAYQKGDKIVVSSMVNKFKKELSTKDLQGKLIITQDTNGKFTFETKEDDTPDTLEITYVKKAKEVASTTTSILLKNVLPAVSDTVQSYITDAGNNAELLKLRNGPERKNWQAYRDAIELGTEEGFQKAHKLLDARYSTTPKKISLDPEGLTIDDLRAIDAAMSVVQLTKNKLVVNKMNSIEQRTTKALALWDTVKEDFYGLVEGPWTSGKIFDNKDITPEVIRGLVSGKIAFSAYHEHLYGLMAGQGRKDGKGAYFKNVMSPIYQLFWLLAPNKHILEPRTRGLTRKLSEKEGLSKDAIDDFKNLRKQAVKPIGNTATYTLEKNTTSYAMVLGYADNGAIEEKFLPHPEMVKGASTPLENDELKKYFLDNLPNNSPIIANIIDLCGDRETAITAIIAGEWQGLAIESSFSLGFYGKCFNETILLDALVVQQPQHVPEQLPDLILTDQIDTKETFCSDGVRYNSVGTESIAHKEKKTIMFGWIGGDPTTTEQVIDSESHTEIRDLEEYMKELQENNPELFEQVSQQIADALSGTVQPGQEIIINGQPVDGWPVAGTNQIIYIDRSNPNQSVMMIYDKTTQQIIRAETFYGPYDQMMTAIANKGLEMQHYGSKVSQEKYTTDGNNQE